MAKNTDRFSHNPGIGLLLTFLIMLFVNYLAISLAANLFPNQIVLGTASITRHWALVYSATAISLVSTFAVPLILEWERLKRKTLAKSGWMKIYLAINFLGVWVIGRFADNLGLGFTSWKVVLGLAVVLDFVQSMAMITFEKWKTE